MDDKYMQAYLDKLDESNKIQAKYAKKQYHMTIIAAVAAVMCMILSLYAYLSVIPKFNNLYTDLQTSVQNIETISNSFANSDLDGMISDVETLVTDSQTTVTEASDKINSIDIDTLNAAIQNLSDVVEPLAKFFNTFKF